MSYESDGPKENVYQKVLVCYKGWSITQAERVSYFNISKAFRHIQDVTKDDKTCYLLDSFRWEATLDVITHISFERPTICCYA